jgi:hypothetical protein
MGRGTGTSRRAWVGTHEWMAHMGRKGAHTGKGVHIGEGEGCGEELRMIREGKLRRARVGGRRVVINLECFGKENLGVYREGGVYG